MCADRRPFPPARRAFRAPGALLLLGLLLVPGAVRAQQPVEHELQVGLSYHAPRSCPSGGSFLEALRKHASAGDGPIETDVRIVRRPASADFELLLELRVAGRRFTSLATSPSCETLVELAALNAGIARTAASDEAVAQVDEPAVAELIPLAPPAPPQLSLPSAGTRDSGVANTPAASGSTPTRVFAQLALRTANAMLPELAWGKGAAAGLARGPWSLRMTGLWWGSRRERSSSDGSSPLSLSFEQASLELAPCLGPDLGAVLRLDGCVLLAGHRVHTSEAETHVFGTVGAAALLSLQLWQGLRLELQGGLQAAPAAPRFHVARRVRVYQPELLQPIAQLALGWEFGAAEAAPALEPAERREANDAREAAR